MRRRKDSSTRKPLLFHWSYVPFDLSLEGLGRGRVGRMLPQKLEEKCLGSVMGVLLPSSASRLHTLRSSKEINKMKGEHRRELVRGFLHHVWEQSVLLNHRSCDHSSEGLALFFLQFSVIIQESFKQHTHLHVGVRARCVCLCERTHMCDFRKFYFIINQSFSDA